MTEVETRLAHATPWDGASAPVRRSVWFREPSEPAHLVFQSFEGAVEVCCHRILANSRFGRLSVRSELAMEGACPPTHQRAALRVVDELVSNAMEHAFQGRSQGRLFTRIVCRPTIGVDVSVRDDGRGFGNGSMLDGNGFRLLRTIGTLRFSAIGAPFPRRTVVGVLIPVTTIGAFPPDRTPRPAASIQRT